MDECKNVIVDWCGDVVLFVMMCVEGCEEVWMQLTAVVLVWCRPSGTSVLSLRRRLPTPTRCSVAGLRTSP